MICKIFDLPLQKNQNMAYYSIRHKNGNIIVNVENIETAVKRLKEININTKETELKKFTFK